MNSEKKLLINARTVKFMLGLEPEEQYALTYDKKLAALNTFLKNVDSSVLVDFYRAAISEDGYCYMPQYSEGFKLLEVEVVRRGLLSLEKVNSIHRRTATFPITVGDEGTFIHTETKEDTSEIIQRYSKMKFGDVREIEFFAEAIATDFITRIQTNCDGLLTYFQSIKEKEEHIVLFVPGIRNVHTSSNFVLQTAVEHINAFLALSDLPTITFVTLPRLASDKSNYAQLSKDERKSRLSVTQTQLPGKDFFAHGVHVIFGDDVRVTGATAERVRDVCLNSGALSFREMYALAISPDLAHVRPETEHDLNTFIVKGGLDEHIADILQQPTFQPVQRLVRLILDPKNCGDLREFLRTQVPARSLTRLYMATLGNDYLSQEKYYNSARILINIAAERAVVSEFGLLKERKYE
jgi:hypothetical protein